MRKLAAAILIGVLITACLSVYSDEVNEALAENIVRLHIIADSDDEEDQAVKLKVRDRVLKEMDRLDGKDEVAAALPKLERIANEVLEEEGFSYKATAEYGRFDFPTKSYENFSLPKGEYDAVRIKLGRAEGQNWWCVLFPPLCYVDAATEEGDALLKETFGENYETVKNDGKLNVKIKFKIAELF